MSPREQYLEEKVKHLLEENELQLDIIKGLEIELAQYLKDGDTVRIVRLGISTDEQDDIMAGLKVGNIYKVSLPGPKNLDTIDLVELVGTKWPSTDGRYGVITNQIEKVDLRMASAEKRTVTEEVVTHVEKEVIDLELSIEEAQVLKEG